MSEVNREAVEANKSRVEAALIDYFAILDRGESVDLEAFLARHAEVSTELRSYIAFDKEARRIAQGAKAPFEPLPSTPGASTHSVMGPTVQTSAGKPAGDAVPQAVKSGVASPEDLPAIFGRYEVEKWLGAGAMGAVYLAFDTVLERNVALKTPTFENDDDGELLRRFYREARAVSKIKHHNLCSVYDVGEIGGRYYISMEFVPGRKLTNFIKPDKPMIEKQAMAIIQKVALAMDEAHSHDVVHRDLKPDNIMINNKGEPVVMDFGLVHNMDAKNSTRLSQKGALIGSPSYMSPEQVEGDHEKLTPATDQFSLGVIFYQLLTARLPFEGRMPAVLNAIATKAPPPPTRYRPELNPRVEAVCLKMMAKKVEDRYSSMKAVAEAIAEVDPLSSDAGPTLNEFEFAVDQESRHNSHFDVPTNLLRSLRSKRLYLNQSLVGVLALAAMCAVYTITLRLKGRDGKSTEFMVSVDAGPSTVPSTRPDARVDQRTLTTSVSGQPKTSHSQSIQDHSQPKAEDGWYGWLANAPKPAVVPFSAAQAKQHQQAWADYLQVPVEFTNSIGMKFVLVPPGEFVRGNTPAEIDEGLAIVPDHKPVREYLQGQKTIHNVVLTQPKYVGIHEVTRAQFRRVTDQSPSGTHNGKLGGLDTANLPVDTVNWFDAITFCAKLSNLEKLDYNAGYCLPTEAEWQFACRAGATTKYWNGDSEAELARIGWYGPNSGGRPHAVGELAANPFGLFDVHGNVIEWCQDRWDAKYFGQLQKVAIDPRGPASGQNPGIIKGGDYYFEEFSCRASSGCPTDTWYCDERFGFRVVLPVSKMKLVQKAVLLPQQRAVIDRIATASGNGLWRIEGGELVQSMPVRATLLFGSCEWIDYDFQLELMREGGSDGIQIYFRSQDPGNSCLFGLGSYGNKWHEAVYNFKGIWGRDVTPIPDRSLPNDEWQKVLIKVRGSHFTLRLNDEELFAYDESRFPCGLIGLQTFDCKARFRNIKVTDPAGTVLWEGLPELPGSP